MVINLHAETLSPRDKHNIYADIVELFAIAHDSRVNKAKLGYALLQDPSEFIKFQTWVKAEHNVSIERFAIADIDGHALMLGVTITEDPSFTNLLLLISNGK